MTVVKNLEEIPVENPEDILKILQTSLSNRATHETLCNVQSSRSHSVFTVMIETREKDPETIA